MWQNCYGVAAPLRRCEITLNVESERPSERSGLPEGCI